MNGYAHIVKIKGHYALYITNTPSLEGVGYPVGYYDSKKEAKEASLNLGLKPWNF